MTEPNDNAPSPTPADRTNESEITGARMASLTAYLEVNRGRFTEPSLRRAALAAGYTTAEVDTAWSRVTTAEPSADPARPPFSGAQAGVSFIAFIVVSWLAVSAFETLGRTVDQNVAWWIVGWLGVGLIGTVLWWMIRDTRPSLARGVGGGVLVLILLPIVLIVAIFGICLVTGSPFLVN